MNNICKTCEHARWKLSNKGRVKPSEPGRCLYPVDIGEFELPVSIIKTKIYRIGGSISKINLINHELNYCKIWWDYTEECKCWEKIKRKKREKNEHKNTVV